MERLGHHLSIVTKLVEVPARRFFRRERQRDFLLEAKLPWIKQIEDSLIGDGQLDSHTNPWAWRSYQSCNPIKAI
jgi:hypothetical protein